nr:tRNA lysidine(34) synthetase TilS [Roseateles koreensis]
MIGLAYSGGRDSSALLHATLKAAQQLNAAGCQPPLGVLALHIHHGLNPQADGWARHCQAQCEAWAQEGLPVRLQIHRLAGQPLPKDSVEAWAREQRHAALDAMARAAGVSLLLLAHHRRDQAETLLLQGLRGAGVAGLAGMPVQQWRKGLCWARPWLTQTREHVQAYVQAHHLRYIDDDSNNDPRYARNRLRLQVWPSLLQAFPQAESKLADAASWAQEALALQREIAQEDLSRLASACGLDMRGVLQLSAPRASNVLRAWLTQVLGRPARATLVARLLSECAVAQSGEWSGGFDAARQALQLCFYRGFLTLKPAAKRWEETTPAAEAAKGDSPVAQWVAPPIDLSQPGLYPQAGWGGLWRVDPVAEGGVAPTHLTAVTVRPRQGGEQFQKAARSAPRSLKKAYQEAGIPAWQRVGPCLFAGQQLLYAVGLGLDARYRAAAGTPQMQLTWVHDAPSALAPSPEPDWGLERPTGALPNPSPEVG